MSDSLQQHCSDRDLPGPGMGQILGSIFGESQKKGVAWQAIENEPNKMPWSGVQDWLNSRRKMGLENT